MNFQVRTLSSALGVPCSVPQLPNLRVRFFCACASMLANEILGLWKPLTRYPMGTAFLGGLEEADPGTDDPGPIDQRV